MLVGLLAVSAAGCASGCLFFFNLEAATHPQSPLRSWDVAAGASLHETIDVDQSKWPSPTVDVELGLYSAPYERVPVACVLRVAASTPTGDAVKQDEAPETRPSHCSVHADAPGPTRLAVDATNLSDRRVMVWVTPASPGFDRRTKIAWAGLAVMAALGVGLAVLGGFLRKRERR